MPPDELTALARQHRIAWRMWVLALALVICVVSASRWHALHADQADELARMADAGRALQQVLALQLPSSSVNGESLKALLRTALYAADMEAELTASNDQLLARAPAALPSGAGAALRWQRDWLAEDGITSLRLSLSRDRQVVLKLWRERSWVALLVGWWCLLLPRWLCALCSAAALLNCCSVRRMGAAWPWPCAVPTWGFGILTLRSAECWLMPVPTRCWACPLSKRSLIWRNGRPRCIRRIGRWCGPRMRRI